jgi:putative transposase
MPNTGAHTRWDIKYHLVWIPKYRVRALRGVVRSEYLKWILKKLAAEYEFAIVEMEVMPDHVHLFIEAPPRHSPSKLMNVIKSITAREMFSKFPDLRKEVWSGRFWATGYYVGTVGDKVTEEAVRRYIRDQKKHLPEVDDGATEE